MSGKSARRVHRTGDQAFFVSESTRILVGIYACADGVQNPDTGNVTCDFDEFEA